MRRGLLLFLAFAAGCGGSDERRVVSVPMEERSGSTQFGEAVLTDLGDSRTQVELSVGSAGRTQYARIFSGSCEHLGQNAYGLADVIEGESTTELDVSLDRLLDAGYAIAVVQAPDDRRLLAVCGEVGS